MESDRQKNVYGLPPYIKLNTKQINYLNGRAKIIKSLEENIGINLCDFELSNNFLDKATKA